MEAVFGLLLMLLSVSHGVETTCDVRQKNGSQCYGALGGAVDLQLMDRTPERFEIHKNATKILLWKNNRFDLNMNPDKYSFTPNDGMLRISNLNRSDTDEYKLQIRNSDGALLEDRTLRLSIQAPVSSARLVTECLSQGEMRVSCSSEGGDSPQYSWTLGGHTLTEDKLLSGNHETDNITLRQDVEGVLVCSVNNHVSHFNVSQKISTCVFINCTDSNGTRITQWMFAASDTLCVEPKTTSTTPDTTVVMAGLLAALVFFLVVGGAVMYALKKKKTNQLEEEGDEQELTYADVRIKQRGPVQQRANPEEVEYGQIKFSERPRRTVEPREDDCVYAKVR
ncbi:hepatocyte cell adhesion molecule isoform X9 [Pleuronectes platessa]|uniref:hepatocyte cell adhesion molecule isoform X9 n=1 Tax=Pleuronectes platessa TaxID=8262 RepID=UPI00232A7574|nr:hepatocyte cell adhesion molecule isoform X9 [Pleuronectes platessa]